MNFYLALRVFGVFVAQWCVARLWCIRSAAVRVVGWWNSVRVV